MGLSTFRKGRDLNMNIPEYSVPRANAITAQIGMGR